MKINNLYRFFIIFSFLISFFASCTKEAPTVNPADYIEPTEPTIQPGYYYPFVTAVYPANGTNDVAVNSDYIIVFNMAVDGADLDANIRVYSGLSSGYLTNGTDYEIYDINGNNPPTDPTTVARIVFDYGGVNPLLGGDNLQISVLAGIHEAVSGTDVAINLDDSVGINASSPWSFSTGTEPDVTSPVLAGGGSPTNPPDAPLDTTVQFNFSGAPTDLDITSINYKTFYVEDSSFNKITGTYSYLAGTETFTPATVLVPGETYTVYVDVGIKDLSGNALDFGAYGPAPYFWSFTTTTTPYDPNLMNPTFDDGPNVFDIALTSAYVNWTTSEATDYSINWGRGDDFPEIPKDGSDDFSSFQSYEFTGLTPGERYWMNVVASDNQDNSVTSSTVQFNTLTPHTGEVIDDNTTGNQGTVHTIVWNPLNSDPTGIFMLWTSDASTNNHLYGQMYDDGRVEQWNSGSPNAVFTEVGQNFTYLSSVEDDMDGVIVLASRGGTGVYAKRINSTINGTAPHIVDWGASADEATDSGLAIDAAGSNGTAVPVYSGFISSPVSGGTTEMNIPSDPFYDFSMDFFWYRDNAGLNNGDYVYDTASHNVVTVTLSSNYRHALGQSSPEITAGNGYRIYDQTASATNVNAANHQIVATSAPVIGTNYTGNYTCGTNVVYTEHGVTGVASNGYLVRRNISGTYARINAAPSTIGPLGNIRTGNSIKASTGRLSDDINLNIVQANDYVVNDDTSAVPTTVSSNYGDYWELTLSNGTLPVSNGDEYYIYDGFTNYVADGTATYDTTGTLEDNVTNLSSVDDGDNIVIGSYTTVSNYVDANNIDLTDNLLVVNNGDDYVIYDGFNNYIASGIADADDTGSLYDAEASFTPAYVGYRIVIGSSTQVAASGVNSYYGLILTNGAFVFNFDDEYHIYDQYCSLHSTDLDQFDSFNRIQFDWGIGIASGNTFNVYPFIVSGTASTGTPIANPLYDNAVNLSAVDAGDIVLNYSTGNWTTVSDDTYAASGALALDDNYFSNGQDYEVITFDAGISLDASDIQHIGTAGSISGNILTVDSTASMLAGDVIYNLTDNDYAMIREAPPGTTITLSNIASFDNNSERYVIIRCAGVLYVWEDPGNLIRGRIMSIGTSPVELVSEATIGNIASGSNPKAISDGLGNALVVYEDTNGEIQVEKIDATGTTIWTTEIDTQTANAETILDVQSDNSNGVVILFKYNNDLHAQRVNSAGVRQWPVVGGDGRTFDDDGATTVTSQEFMVYDSDNVYIVAITGAVPSVTSEIWADSNLWAAPVYITNLPLSTQQNPKIFLNGADALIVWDDSRFQQYMGYGVFGMNINAASGVKDTDWYANTSGSDDTDGVAIILSNFNEKWPNVHLAPYDSGGEVMLIWEDYESGSTSDLLYIDFATFTPY